MTIIERIDSEIERYSLLKHPFYKAWSEGKLSLDQLRGYSMEYFQLVKQVPLFVENVRSKTRDEKLHAEISQNLREETEHIEPWKRFAFALGVNEEELLNYAGEEKTKSAVSEINSATKFSSSFEAAVAAMYAYEKELPKISRSKIDGLKKFYGLESHDALNYFGIHEIADIKHAELWRNILQNLPEEMEEAVILAARRSLAAQNMLLDSVMEKYCSYSESMSACA
ncbi:MAG: TenA family transcriptional regulator [Nitrososphaerales archaeon]